MNLGTAIETMQLALKLDAKLEISTLLQRTIESMSNLTSSPAEPSFQVNARTALDNLAANLTRIDTELSDADKMRLEELGASELFPSDLYDRIVNHFTANVATPSVSQNYVQEILNARNAILAAFSTVVGVAETQGWDMDVAIANGAEIGFTVPRAIFDNKLKGLTKELEWINRFMAAVTEATTGAHEEFEVSRLATTDPTVFIQASYAVALTVGGVVTWALASWKSVEEIRNLRAQTNKLASFSAEEVEEIFGNKIKEQVHQQIAAQADMLTASIQDNGRKNELNSGLTILLEQFLQRVERGMTVEIRLIEDQTDEQEENSGDDADTISKLNEIAAELTFPTASTTPVLRLTGGASDVAAKPNGASGNSSPRSKKAGQSKPEG